MEKKFLQGYAVKWMHLSVEMNLNGKPFVEMFQRGAFTKSLNRHEQFALGHHDTKIVLGNTSANLRLTEDSIGLRFSLELPNTQEANDIYELVSKRILKGVSFGFRNAKAEWGYPGENKTLRCRKVIECDLNEISIVAFPAYQSSTVEAYTQTEEEALMMRRKRLSLIARCL